MSSVSHVMTLATCGFWPGWSAARDPVAQAFASSDHVMTDDISHADLLIHSVFGFPHHVSLGTRLAVSVEPGQRPIGAHWTIDNRLSAGPNHLHLPTWAYTLLEDPSTEVRTPVDADRPHFCNFIYSNPASRPRNLVFWALDARRGVHSFGPHLRNRVDPRLHARKGSWRSPKFDVMADYRFTIAFENSSHPGYTSEKLIDAWIAGTVPIYWGNPEVARDFPADAMLILDSSRSLDDLVEEVLAVDADPQRYAELQRANPFRTGEVHQRLEAYRASLTDFVGRVKADALEHAGRPRVSEPERRWNELRDRVWENSRLVRLRASRFAAGMERRVRQRSWR